MQALGLVEEPGRSSRISPDRAPFCALSSRAMTLNPHDFAASRAQWRYRGDQRPPWAETPRPGQESVWDYPRPPRVEPAPGDLSVRFAGTVLAHTHRGLRIVETAGAPTYYFPPDDVDRRWLQRSAHRTVCEWKGEARYAHVQVANRTSRNAAWWYEDPWPGFEAVAGWPSFHPAHVDACTIDGVRAEPQPGGLYGGWVTPNLAGPIKGEPGTGSW